VIRDGIAYVLTDTAGLAAETNDAIERIGIDRAREAIAKADIAVLLDDTPTPGGAKTIAVHPRADLPGRENAPPGKMPVSAANGQGLEQLWQAIADAARRLLPQLDRLTLNQRQRDHVAEAGDALAATDCESDILVLAEQLRIARVQLDRVTGASDTEAMLDALFGRFCIGK
jgi:tRNA modification GTPase